jgi:hypothetical protein
MLLTIAGNVRCVSLHRDRVLLTFLLRQAWNHDPTDLGLTSVSRISGVSHGQQAVSMFLNVGHQALSPIYIHSNLQSGDKNSVAERDLLFYQTTLMCLDESTKT